MADVLMARGDVEQSVPILERAAAALAPTGYSWGPLAWMLLAQALGQLGRVSDAGRILARAESRHGLKSMLFAPELALARAWTSAARRDGPGAINAAREAARAAERGGQSAVAVRALIDAVRLGDVRAAEFIERLGCRLRRRRNWRSTMRGRSRQATPTDWTQRPTAFERVGMRAWRRMLRLRRSERVTKPIRADPRQPHPALHPDRVDESLVVADHHERAAVGVQRGLQLRRR